MIRWITLLILAAALASCHHASESISVQVFPAVLAADADSTAANWDSVAFAGSQRAMAGTYLVSRKPLLTEWSIIAYRAAKQPDGTLAVSARLNAYAERKLAAYTSRSANLKRPLAVRIDGRWADFLPILTEVGNHITLYGFHQDEVQALSRYLASK